LKHESEDPPLQIGHARFPEAGRGRVQAGATGGGEEEEKIPTLSDGSREG